MWLQQVVCYFFNWVALRYNHVQVEPRHQTTRENRIQILLFFGNKYMKLCFRNQFLICQFNIIQYYVCTFFWLFENEVGVCIKSPIIQSLLGYSYNLKTVTHQFLTPEIEHPCHPYIPLQQLSKHPLTPTKNLFSSHPNTPLQQRNTPFQQRNTPLSQIVLRCHIS